MEECESETQLSEREIYHINILNSTCFSGTGYNMTIGGDGVLSGTKLSPEHRANIAYSQTLSGFINKYGSEVGLRKYTEKCKRLSDTQSIRFLDEVERYKCANYGTNNGMFNKHHNEDTIAKIREANIGRIPSLETKRKLSERSSGSNNPMFNNGYKISSDKNGRAKKWLLISPDSSQVELHGDVISACQERGLSSQVLLRLKNTIISITPRKCKNLADYQLRMNTIGWGLFEKNL